MISSKICRGRKREKAKEKKIAPGDSDSSNELKDPISCNRGCLEHGFTETIACPNPNHHR